MRHSFITKVFARNVLEVRRLKRNSWVLYRVKK